MAETSSESIARLLQNGGTVLIVGGGISKLPQAYHEHPQIILWDDQVQGVNRDVPSNTRAIIFNRWISHSTSERLIRAGKALHIPIFPMLRTRELKELTMSLVHEIEEVSPPATELRAHDVEVSEPSVELTSHEEIMRKPGRGEIREFVAKYGDPTKMKSEESLRLLKMLKERGVKSTAGSLKQALYMVNNKGKGVTASVEKKPQPRTEVRRPVDLDLDEAVKLLENAKTAIDLLVEFVPKLQQEVQRQRDRMTKLREMLD